jgi:outer membrane lipoprotein-sorting protein
VPILAAAFVAVVAAAPATATAATPATSGAPAATTTPTPSVAEIVDRHVAACGGLKKIKSIQSLRETGRVTTGANREALVTRERKRPGRARFEFTVQGVTSVYVSDGQRGWRMSPFDGDTDPNPLPDEVVIEASEQGDLEGPLVDWKAKGHQVELVGREVLDGRETWKLKITLKSGAVRHEYFDVKSFQRVRTDSTRQVRGRPVQIETTFSDYKKTGGILFPRLIEVAAVGRPQRLRVVVDSIEVNPVLDDARFEMPASVRP